MKIDSSSPLRCFKRPEIFYWSADAFLYFTSSVSAQLFTTQRCHCSVWGGDLQSFIYHSPHIIRGKQYAMPPCVLDCAGALVSCAELIMNSLVHISRELFISDTKRIHKMSSKIFSRVLMLWDRKMWPMARLTLTVSDSNKHACSRSGMCAVVRFTLHLLQS